ncbi:MAG TPA: THUMP domain-containing protein, partial [Spirochaetia bacterium]|nr:THUMP domain-containing protein [Spirochaetia bacterium]
MKNLYLIKFGELTLRKQNLRYYIKVLRSNVKKQLAGTDASVESRDKRMYVHASLDHDKAVREALDRTFGIAGYARVIPAEKTIDAVANAAIALTAESLNASVPAPTSFRITARRSDKSFPLNSFEIGREIGSAVLDRFPRLKVDLENPGFTVNIEIREKAYLYSRVTPGLRGLPVGVSG